MNDNNLNNNEQNNQSISVQTPSNNENANVVEVNVDFIDDSIENRLMESEKNVEENTQVPVNTINENTETNQVVVESSFQSNEPVKQAPENNQGEVFVSFNNEQPTVKKTSGVENNGLDEYLDKYKDSDYQNYLKEKKRRESRFPIKKILKVLLKIIIFGVIAFGIYYLVVNFKNIFGNFNIKNMVSDIKISGNGVVQSLDNYYIINDKVDKINVKKITFSTIEKTDIKIYAGSLALFENKYENTKSYDLDISNLALGMNIMEIDFSYNKDKKEKKTIYLYNKSEENLKSLDKNDDDKDGLLNYQETIYGTNKKKSDTDSDGLSDYYELVVSLTDPLKDKSFGKTLDGEEDYDKDGLTNNQEEYYKTNPLIKDTDSDGLSDYDEIFRYKTNPLIKDSDSDGIDDKDEISIKSNPSVKNTTFDVTKKSNDNIFTVHINKMDKDTFQSLNIVKSNNTMIDKNNPSYISGPYNVSVDGNIKNATISFKLSNVDKNVSIYYINSENNTIEEVKTTRKGDVVSANVNHFSEYIVLDKEYIDNLNKKAPKSNIIKKSSDTEYIFLSFPILSAISDYPVYIYEVDGREEIMQRNEKILNKAVNQDEKLDLKVEFKSISKFGAKVLKLLLSIFEDKGSNNGDFKKFLQFFIMYKYTKGSDNLITYLFGDSSNNIVLEESEKTNEEEDSNNDGLIDEYVKNICEGKITTEYGANPFAGVSYEEIQNNKDYDKDGLINGEEIEVVDIDGKLFVVEKSSPISIDSDNDGLVDSRDKLPLVAFDSNFKVSNKLTKKIELTSLEENVEEYNSLFGTGKIVTKKLPGDSIEYMRNGETKYSKYYTLGYSLNIFFTTGASLGNLVGAADAQYAYFKYYQADAKPYTEESLQEPRYTSNGKENPRAIVNSEDVNLTLNYNLSKLINVAEDSVKDGNTEIFESKNYLRGTGAFEQSFNVLFFLHTSSSYMVAEVTNEDDTYKMKLRYVLGDIYDWDSEEECTATKVACYTEVPLFNDMLLGLAKAFLVQLEYDYDVEWTKGGTPKITLLDGTPYKNSSLSGKF